MDRGTIDAFNSPFVRFYQDNQGKTMVGIEINDVLNGNVSLCLKAIQEENLLVPVSAPPVPDAKPVIVSDIIVPNALKEAYKAAKLGSKEQLYDEIATYLDLVAICWTSTNRTESAITGSLVGKVSKTYSDLNEKVFRGCGSARRDAFLKELIKANLPYLQKIWDQKK